MTRNSGLRVCLVVPAYYPATDYGGPVAKVRLLASALASAGALPEVWTADYGAGRTRVPIGQRSVDGIPTRYFRRIGGFHWSPVVPQVAITAERSGLEIAHCFGMRDGMTYFAALGFRNAGVPYVVETLGMYRPMLRGIGRKRLYDRVVGGLYLRGSAGLIVTSEQEQHDIQSLSKYALWRRDNPLEAMSPVEDTKPVLRFSLEIPQGAPLVGWLGRISRSKGLDLLIAAVAALPSVHLALAGPDDGDGTLPVVERAIRNSGAADRMHVIGPVWGLQRDQFWASIDVFALPSRTENFGNAAVEAAGVGLPVVISDRCGASQLLRRLGAATVVPLEIRAIRDALSAALASPRGPLSFGLGSPAAAVRAELAPDVIARRQLEIYTEILNAGEITPAAVGST